jgi:hypothetical protein
MGTSSLAEALTSAGTTAMTWANAVLVAADLPQLAAGSTDIT